MFSTLYKYSFYITADPLFRALSGSGKPMSPNKHSSHSLTHSNTVNNQPVVTGGQLQYANRPCLSPDRSSINSILNLFGAWLFEAALSHDRRSRPGRFLRLCWILAGGGGVCSTRQLICLLDNNDSNSDFFNFNRKSVAKSRLNVRIKQRTHSQ